MRGVMLLLYLILSGSLMLEDLSLKIFSRGVHRDSSIWVYLLRLLFLVLCLFLVGYWLYRTFFIP